MKLNFTPSPESAIKDLKDIGAEGFGEFLEDKFDEFSECLGGGLEIVGMFLNSEKELDPVYNLLLSQLRELDLLEDTFLSEQGVFLIINSVQAKQVFCFNLCSETSYCEEPLDIFRKSFIKKDFTPLAVKFKGTFPISESKATEHFCTQNLSFSVHESLSFSSFSISNYLLVDGQFYFLHPGNQNKELIFGKSSISTSKLQTAELCLDLSVCDNKNATLLGIINFDLIILIHVNPGVYCLFYIFVYESL